jgi:hypothetical protein
MSIINKLRELSFKLANEKVPDFWRDDIFDYLWEQAMFDNVKDIDLHFKEADQALKRLITEAKAADLGKEYDKVLTWLESEHFVGDGFYRLNHILEYDWGKYVPDNEALAREFAKEAHLKQNYIKPLNHLFERYNFAEELKKAGLQVESKWTEQSNKIYQLIDQLLETHPPTAEDTIGSIWVRKYKDEWKS